MLREIEVIFFFNLFLLIITCFSNGSIEVFVSLLYSLLTLESDLPLEDLVQELRDTTDGTIWEDIQSENSFLENELGSTITSSSVEAGKGILLHTTVDPGGGTTGAPPLNFDLLYVFKIPF